MAKKSNELDPRIKTALLSLNPTAIEFMHGIAEHNRYHSAAIKLIRSAYEAWE